MQFLYLHNIRDTHDDGVLHTYLRVVYLICVLFLFSGRRAVDSSWHQRVRLKYRPFIVSLHTTLVNEKNKNKQITNRVVHDGTKFVRSPRQNVWRVTNFMHKCAQKCTTYRTTYNIFPMFFLSFIIIFIINIINFMLYNFVQSLPSVFRIHVII